MNATNPDGASASRAETLRTQITRKLAELDGFILRTRPSLHRLSNTTILAGALSALLTSGPALGGQTLTGWLTGVLGLENPAWQLLCAGAALSSLAATVAAQLLKSRRLEERLIHAVTCRARLESLETGLSLGMVTVEYAGTEYLRCIEEAAVIRE
jgi:MFS family permease